MTAYILVTTQRGRFVKLNRVLPSVHEWTHDRNEAHEFNTHLGAELYAIQAGISNFVTVETVRAREVATS